MKKLFLLSVTFLFYYGALAQLELTTGYAVNKDLADGAPIHVGYDINIKNRFFTKPQIGYKNLFYYNDFVGATLKVTILEFHQTFSYQVVKNKKYVFKPNIGVNYRWYTWRAKMKLPYDQMPIRAWVIGVRNRNIILSSSTSDGKTQQTYKVNNLGFSLQFQNQFKLNGKLWLHVTPFLEPDYDRSQNTGGCYLGLVLLNL